jgi:hypothetical protein
LQHQLILGNLSFIAEKEFNVAFKDEFVEPLNNQKNNR